MVQAFGQEALERQNYLKYLRRSRKAQQDFVVALSRGLGLFLSSFFFFYAYATHYAVKMRLEGVERRPGEVYTGG